MDNFVRRHLFVFLHLLWSRWPRKLFSIYFLWLSRRFCEPVPVFGTLERNLPVLEWRLCLSAIDQLRLSAPALAGGLLLVRTVRSWPWKILFSPLYHFLLVKVTRSLFEKLYSLSQKDKVPTKVPLWKVGLENEHLISVRIATNFEMFKRLLWFKIFPDLVL